MLKNGKVGRRDKIWKIELIWQMLTIIEPSIEAKLIFLKFKIIEKQCKNCVSKNERLFLILRIFKLLSLVNIYIAVQPSVVQM